MTPIEKPNIVAVFEYYELRILGPDRGGWRKAECPKPDHIDQNPSASINEDAQRWFCHACNEGGDGLDIIAEREGLDFKAAHKFATDNFEGDHVAVETGSSLLPRGSRPGRRNWTAPWTRL